MRMKRGSVCGLLAAALLAAGAASAAPTAVEYAFPSPLLNLAVGQLMRLSVVNITDPAAGPGAICQVEMNFVNGDGVSVRPQPKVHVLEPGRSAFLDLPYDEVPTAPGKAPETFTDNRLARPLVRASCTGPGGRPTLFPSVQASAEILDAETGRASILSNPGPVVVRVRHIPEP